jgi:subtilisin family serine protease
LYQYIQRDMAAINAPQAWDRTVGSSSVVIAVIDTGIDYNHPDLVPNIWVNPGERIDGADNDGNGYADDVYGYNFAYGIDDPNDDHMHGTHVAGIAGAVGNNGTGVAGVNWNVKLAALKVLDFFGAGSDSHVIEGIDYAVNLKRRGINIRVLNLSLGAEDARLCTAIANATAQGILTVAAAGNGGEDLIGDNNDSVPTPPANCPGVISVAAFSAVSNSLTSFSNFGANTVSLAAPGEEVFSTIPMELGGYEAFPGTSMAAPQVSGAAALLLSLTPSLTPDQIRSRIESTVTKHGSLSGRVKTGGVLNVGGAVANAPPPSTYTVTGQVYVPSKYNNGTSAWLSNVRVYIGSTPVNGKKNYYTNSKGRYTIANVPSGTKLNLWFYKLSADGKTKYRFSMNKFDVPNSIDVINNGTVNVRYVKAYPVAVTSSAAASIRQPPAEKMGKNKKRRI